jgi:hypothetical protein
MKRKRYPEPLIVFALRQAHSGYGGRRSVGKWVFARPRLALSWRPW